MGRCASLVKPYTFVFNAHIILKQSGSTQVSCQVKPTVKCVFFQDKNFDLLCTEMWCQCFSVTANVSSILCVVCWQAIRWRLSPGNDIVVTWMMRVGSGQWVALFCCCMERLGSKILPLFAWMTAACQKTGVASCITCDGICTASVCAFV